MIETPAFAAILARRRAVAATQADVFDALLAEARPVELLDAATSERLAREIDRGVELLVERGCAPLDALLRASEEVEARYAAEWRPTEDEIEAELVSGRAEAQLGLAAVDASREQYRAELNEGGEPTEAPIEAAVAQLRRKAGFVAAALRATWEVRTAATA